MLGQKRTNDRCLKKHKKREEDQREERKYKTFFKKSSGFSFRVVSALRILKLYKDDCIGEYESHERGPVGEVEIEDVHRPERSLRRETAYQGRSHSLELAAHVSPVGISVFEEMADTADLKQGLS